MLVITQEEKLDKSVAYKEVCAILFVLAHEGKIEHHTYSTLIARIDMFRPEDAY